MSKDRQKVSDTIHIHNFNGAGWRGTVEEFTDAVDLAVGRATELGWTDLMISQLAKNDDDYASLEFVVEGTRDEADEEMKCRLAREAKKQQEFELCHFGELVKWAHESIQRGSACADDFVVEFLCSKCGELNTPRELKDDDVGTMVLVVCPKCDSDAAVDHLPALRFKGELL